MSWIQTYSGKAFDPFNPNPADICIQDIAHALANVCRFTGHTRQFYSVAQHSVEVTTRLPYEFQRHALLHDASEAYLLDLARPLKQRPEFAGYRAAEKALQEAIYTRFGLDPITPPEVKEMDLRMLLLEKRKLMGACAKEWDNPALLLLKPAVEYAYWQAQTPLHAEREFLNVFYLNFQEYADDENDA